jgi:hypothetical protein
MQQMGWQVQYLDWYPAEAGAGAAAPDRGQHGDAKVRLLVDQWVRHAMSAGSDDTGVVRWPAPAKLNLFLHIVGRRDDGYHLLQTAFRCSIGATRAPAPAR